MAETQHDRDPSGPTPGFSELFEDWVTIWQSELAGLVLDRESQDNTLRFIDAWADRARESLRVMAPALDRPVRPAGPVPPPRPTPVADAPVAARQPSDRNPDARDDIIRDLLDRVAELERRLGHP